MEKRERIVLGILLALVIGALTTGVLNTSLSLLQASSTISNAGSVKGVGVGIYWDSTCTNKTSAINWGLLSPGSNKTVLLYVRNEGNSAATLSKTAQNWSPAVASSYITLNWNYAGQTLSVNQVLQVKLTLAVSPTTSGITSFSFDITITATG